MSDTEKAIEILNSHGYDSANYQGPEFRDNIGNLNDYMTASDEMFNKWIAIVVENWSETDRVSIMAAKRAAINAINLLWRSK